MVTKRPIKPTGFIDFHIVGNERGVQRMLDVIDSSLSPTGLAQFLYGAVGPWVKERAQDRFAQEGDDVSGRWAPLQEVTVEIRERAGFEGSHPINVRTTELERYITESDIVASAGPGWGTLKYPGSEPKSKGLREKMKTAQRGRASPSTAARPVLGLNERDLANVMTMLALHVQGAGRAGRAFR